MGKIMSVKQVAEILGVSKQQVYKYIYRAHDPLPAIRAGSVMVVLSGELEEWLAKQTGRKVLDTKAAMMRLKEVACDVKNR